MEKEKSVEKMTINISFKDGMSDTFTFSKVYNVDYATKRAQEFMFDYVNNEDNPMVDKFEVFFDGVSQWTYKPTYPDWWRDNTKLKVYVSYCVFRYADDFIVRDIFDELDTREEAKKVARSCGGFVKVCCSALFDNDISKGSSMFAYGDTKAQARKNLRKEAESYGYTLRKGFEN